MRRERWRGGQKAAGNSTVIARVRRRTGSRPSSRARGAAALLAALTVTAGCTPLDDAMVAIFGRSMRSSVAFDPYENPRRPDSTAVPFASSNYPSAPGVVNLGEPEGLDADVVPLTQADMAAPGSERVNALENPVPTDSASLARGQVMYERMCAPCHGVDGYSVQSTMVQEIPGMQLMTQFNLADGNAVGFSDGYIYGMVRMGRGLMPPYGHRVTHFDRWHVVNYVRELQSRAGALIPPTGAQPDTAGAQVGAAADAAGGGGAAAGGAGGGVEPAAGGAVSGGGR